MAVFVRLCHLPRFGRYHYFHHFYTLSMSAKPSHLGEACIRPSSCDRLRDEDKSGVEPRRRRSPTYLRATISHRIVEIYLNVNERKYCNKLYARFGHLRDGKTASRRLIVHHLVKTPRNTKRTRPHCEAKFTDLSPPPSPQKATGRPSKFSNQNTLQLVC